MPRPVDIVVFAAVPPPEHGQSRMVMEGLAALRSRPDQFRVYHVNARFSRTLEEVGESSLGKLMLSLKYLVHALLLRFRTRSPLLYYVPGPVKWSAMLRDWLLLGVLRIFYRRVVFHWHAIGLGEWAWGGKRRQLDSGGKRNQLARLVSRWVLARPFASLAVGDCSLRDVIAVGSRFRRVVPNGVDDPCVDYDQVIRPIREDRARLLAGGMDPVFRILFLSYGTEEKGLLDAVGALGCLAERADAGWSFEVTFAGGMSEGVRPAFEHALAALDDAHGNRLRVSVLGYVTGGEKRDCMRGHDIFLAPSRWESFGLAVLEAMAYGMEIVAAGSDGVRGLLPAGFPFLPPPGNARSLGDCLHAVCVTLRSGQENWQGGRLREHYLARFQLAHFTARFGDTMAELGAKAVGRRVDVAGAKSLAVRVYLADQNPGHDRSFGISRMSKVVLDGMVARRDIALTTVVSKTSFQGPEMTPEVRLLPWGTRRKWVRGFTDHFHPLFVHGQAPELHYYPKGYLPVTCKWSRPNVVTIHDTIIQYDEDRYPEWRSKMEYHYWARQLRHTLKNADSILTVSESSRGQIESFMKRHGIQAKPVTVTYEPCLYEEMPQPLDPVKENYVIHLASREPHKRTADLVRWWRDAEEDGGGLPMLHLIGTMPDRLGKVLSGSRTIVKRPFLSDDALVSAYRGARALILPSEVEGFGLPALEAYYLGTPVCFVRGTSVEEVLAPATGRGGFDLDNPRSLFVALHDVLAMDAPEIRRCGLKLRETYALKHVVEKMMRAFEAVAESGCRVDSSSPR